MRTLIPALVVIAGLLAGCGKSEPEVLGAAKNTQAHPWAPEDTARIDALFGRTIETASGLRYQPMERGRGDEHPRAGDTVTTHYRGTLLDGTVFDESYKRGQPIRFQVGVGRVIKGWDEALVDMRRGEKRRLIIPYWLAYGDAGRPGVIPRKATLVFEVELLDWESAAAR